MGPGDPGPMVGSWSWSMAPCQAATSSAWHQLVNARRPASPLTEWARSCAAAAASADEPEGGQKGTNIAASCPPGWQGSRRTTLACGRCLRLARDRATLTALNCRCHWQI